MPNLLLVMLGGAIGAGLRHLAGGVALARLGPGFPWGTLFVNLAGGLLIGLLTGWFVRAGANEATRLFLGVGVLGGFTTFSAFSLETFLMVERGEIGIAAAYAGISVIGSVALLLAGLWLMRAAPA
ncbi:MAG TPA: fluoride efflux transporter CrcB [Allosphingosinicella sp.]|jgi:CrcB protein|nr:fluoride efflux transporter CrcB [Allosphingosinicella sp.]